MATRASPFAVDFSTKYRLVIAEDEEPAEGSQYLEVEPSVSTPLFTRRQIRRIRNQFLRNEFFKARVRLGGRTFYCKKCGHDHIIRKTDQTDRAYRHWVRLLHGHKNYT
jgi:hypothetical protein